MSRTPFSTLPDENSPAAIADEICRTLVLEDLLWGFFRATSALPQTSPYCQSGEAHRFKSRYCAEWNSPRLHGLKFARNLARCPLPTRPCCARATFPKDPRTLSRKSPATLCLRFAATIQFRLVRVRLAGASKKAPRHRRTLAVSPGIFQLHRHSSVRDAHSTAVYARPVHCDNFPPRMRIPLPARRGLQRPQSAAARPFGCGSFRAIATRLRPACAAIPAWCDRIPAPVPVGFRSLSP